MSRYRYAAKLNGLTLGNGWTVTKPLGRSSGATGGHFSIGYEVANAAGHRAFLKALDFSDAFSAPNPAQVLEGMTAAFNHERELCERCMGHKMSRVVRYLDTGTIEVESGNPFSNVQYLIFELADGDIRKHADSAYVIDYAFALRVLHEVAVGLRQMHAAGLAHQDLKPSNVMQFGTEAKIGDLGCASSADRTAGHDRKNVAGDEAYAPLNHLYGDVSDSWDLRRRATDLYHLGNLTSFLLARANVTAMVLNKMDWSHHYKRWPESYQMVLPYIRQAFEASLRDIEKSIADTRVASEVKEIVRQLCEPEPAKRGHPDLSFRHEHPYDLQRYVSWFDRLARMCEIKAFGAR